MEKSRDKEAAQRATEIISNPTRISSRKRYLSNENLYVEMLKESGCSLNILDFSASRNMDKDPVTIACALIMKRCGPKAEGFEELKALSTGGAIKSAVVNYWRKNGYDGEYQDLPSGEYSGNPGKCPKLQTLINYLDDAQRASRSNLTKRAYQETHEDIRKVYYKYIKTQLSRAIRKDPSVDYKSLQAAVINVLQFNAVARGNEILSIKTRDLIFTGDGLNSPIIAVLPTTKNKKRSYTYFRFSKQVDISICGLSILQGWLCVLRAYNLDEGTLFLQVTGNQLQGGTCFDGSSYARVLKDIGRECGIPGLAEHSARRGGAGFHYFVLRKDLFFLYRAFSWESLTEMMKYIGIEDVYNSYAMLGFTAFGTNELYFPSSL